MEKSLKEKIQELLPSNAVVLLVDVEDTSKLNCSVIISEEPNVDVGLETSTRLTTFALNGAVVEMSDKHKLTNLVKIGSAVAQQAVELEEAEKEE